MSLKPKVKMLIDVLMTLLMIACMSGLMTGELLHEIFGTLMFLLFVVHNILNYRWYGALFKGKYTASRAFQTVVNILCLVFMVLQGASGVVLSNYLFAFVQPDTGYSLARNIHLAFGYWTLTLVSIHLGLHWAMIMGKMHMNAISHKAVLCALRIILALICVYGLHSFINNQILSYMFLTVHFAFFDYEMPLALFYSEYVAIMVLFAAVGYYVKKLMMLKKRP